MEATKPNCRRPVMRRRRTTRTPDSASYTLPPLPSLLTRPLGLEGWNDLEPVLLAALATCEPMLLIGPHGTAKSFFLERLAQVLELDYRFYNASLINYDDLVGIPMPDETRTGLRYLSTPTAIWDAEIVFIDELSRTRPELQNKLFPIIHECRVQGMSLERLRYRWAAMNPPPSADGEDEDTLAIYLGAEPLDPALADRFPFLIEVPAWRTLDSEAQRRILQDQFRGDHPFPVPPTALITLTTTYYQQLQAQQLDGIIDYVICLVGVLDQQGFTCTARRVTMLHRNILAIHAARMALYQSCDDHVPGAVIDWSTSALLALQHSLPQVAQGKTPDPTMLLAAHRQAWELVRIDVDNPWRILLQINDPLERCLTAVSLGHRVSDDDLSRLMLDALGSVQDDEYRMATALAFYLATRELRALPATTYETLAHAIRPVIQPSTGNSCPDDAQQRARMRKARELAETIRSEATPFAAYAANMLMALIKSDAFDTVTPRQTHDYFMGLLDRLMPTCA